MPLTQAIALPSSPIRWAGSKRRLTPRLLKLLPTFAGTYHEPFAGGANLFFALQPSKARLSDINPEVINFYEVLRSKTEDLLTALSLLEPSKQTYYTIRSQNPVSAFLRAVRFAYLNRLCWNGLYRVNRQGQFNVPIGDRLPSDPWRFDTLRVAAQSLSSATLAVQGFDASLEHVAPGDLVFLDPPYPRGTTDGGIGFNRYSPELWTLEHHSRLAAAAAVLLTSGAHVVITIAGQERYLSHFSSSFRRYHIRTSALISCDGNSRRNTTETILIAAPK